jgi:uracil-DNA glycosylase
MLSLQQVFDSIAHCPNVDRCLNGDTAHPCSKIVLSQQVPKEDFQLPEPWRGQVEKARILFVGSNPSIGDDRYALQSSPPQQVWESQHLAFGGGSRSYIIDGIRTTKADGSPDRVVRYWSSIRARARELLPGSIPGEDYAITEIVHCKSEDEEGVFESASTCYELHMSGVFSVSAAKVVVVLGKVAREAMLGAGKSRPQSPLQMELGGRKRAVLFLPHPNARGDEKSLHAHYSTPALDGVRRLLAMA